MPMKDIPTRDEAKRFYLHPVMRDLVKTLSEQMYSDFVAKRTTKLFRVFETYRTPERQDEVFADGHSKARAWQSAHQYGLAADFVPVEPGPAQLTEFPVWTWTAPDSDWDRLKQRAEALGLRNSIKWDKPHIEHPAFADLKRAIRRGAPAPKPPTGA